MERLTAANEDTLKTRLAADLDRAFPEFVANLQTPVFNGARRWLPARQDAEDITQEVFVRAYKALQEYSPERIRRLKLRPWLFTITLNMCRNHVRRRNRRPSSTELTGDEAVVSETAEQVAVDSVTTDEWRRRLATLPARHRDAIVLRHVIGLTYEEIGDVLQRPKGTVKSDVHRGLARLRTLIETEDSL